MSHLLPTDKSPGPGPDLFFAGGECWSRFGVLVRRTDMDLEAATRPTATRNSVAGMTRGDGVRKQFGIDLPRVDWLNEVDIDPTRNRLDTTNLTQWDTTVGNPTIERLLLDPELFRVSEDDLSLQSRLFIKSSIKFGTVTVTGSLHVKKQRGKPTIGLRVGGGVQVGCAVDVETGEFVLIGAPDEVRVTAAGGYWLCEIVVTQVTSEPWGFDIFPAFGFTLAGGGDVAATGSQDVRFPQIEIGSVATGFQTIPRDREYIFPNLYLEDSGTNGFTFTEELDNAVWEKIRSTISPNVELAPDGQVNADKLVEDASATSTHLLRRDAPAIADDAPQAIAFFAKAGERSDVRALLLGKDGVSRQQWFDLAAGTVGTSVNGATGSIRSLDNGWFRCSIVADSGNGGTTPEMDIHLGENGENVTYTGDGVSGLFLWGIQFEVDTPVATSYMPASATGNPRAVDDFRAPFLAPPQGMSIYVKLIDSGAAELAGDLRLIHVGSASGTADPRLKISSVAAGFRFQHRNGIDSVQATLSQKASTGDHVELLATLFPDGATAISQSLNGDPLATDGPSAALELADAWAGQFLSINGVGGNEVALGRYLAVKVQRGVRSMDFMRRL